MSTKTAATTNTLHIALHMLHIKSHYMIIMWSLSLFVLNKTDSFACHLFLLVLFVFVLVSLVLSSLSWCVVLCAFHLRRMQWISLPLFLCSPELTLARSIVGWHFKHQTIFQRCFCNLEYFIMHTFCVRRVCVCLQFYFSFALFIATVLLLSLLLERFRASHSHSTSWSSSSPPPPPLPPLLLSLLPFRTLLSNQNPFQQTYWMNNGVKGLLFCKMRHLLL